MNNNKESFENTKIKIYLSIFVCLILFGVWVNSKCNLKEIEESGENHLAKFVNIKKFVKSRDYNFLFYDSSVKKTVSVSRVPADFYHNVGKFYYIKYLDKYPELIIVMFDQQVTDTTEILKAGFSIEDF